MSNTEDIVQANKVVEKVEGVENVVDEVDGEAPKAKAKGKSKKDKAEKTEKSEKTKKEKATKSKSKEVVESDIEEAEDEDGVVAAVTDSDGPIVVGAVKKGKNALQYLAHQANDGVSVPKRKVKYSRVFDVWVVGHNEPINIDDHETICRTEWTPKAVAREFCVSHLESLGKLTGRRDVYVKERGTQTVKTYGYVVRKKRVPEDSVKQVKFLGKSENPATFNFDTNVNHGSINKENLRSFRQQCMKRDGASQEDIDAVPIEASKKPTSEKEDSDSEPEEDAPIKEPKAPKAPKEPKAPKTKTPKTPKEPKAPKAKAEGAKRKSKGKKAAVEEAEVEEAADEEEIEVEEVKPKKTKAKSKKVETEEEIVEEEPKEFKTKKTKETKEAKEPKAKKTKEAKEAKEPKAKSSKKSKKVETTEEEVESEVEA